MIFSKEKSDFFGGYDMDCRTFLGLNFSCIGLCWVDYFGFILNDMAQSGS